MNVGVMKAATNCSSDLVSKNGVFILLLLNRPVRYPPGMWLGVYERKRLFTVQTLTLVADLYFFAKILFSYRCKAAAQDAADINSCVCKIHGVLGLSAVPVFLTGYAVAFFTWVGFKPAA